MASPNPENPKNHASHLQVLNLVIAVLAGLISIVGGVYSLKANFFSPKTGTFEGIVRDESIAKPLWLAAVEISTSDGAVLETVSTDPTGHYTSTPLREGSYVVKVSAPLHKAESKNVKIYPGSAATSDFYLGAEEKVSAPAPTEVMRAPAASNLVYANPEAPPSYRQPEPIYQENPQTAVQPRPYSRRYRRSRWESQNQEPYSEEEMQAQQQQQPPPTSREVLTQAVGQLISDWAAKKAASKTTTN